MIVTSKNPELSLDAYVQTDFGVGLDCDTVADGRLKTPMTQGVENEAIQFSKIGRGNQRYGSSAVARNMKAGDGGRLHYLIAHIVGNTRNWRIDRARAAPDAVTR
jgi:hypothetical protein